MIKFIVSLLLIALLSFTLCLYMPWWSIAIVAFAVSAIIYQKPYLSFVAGFLSLLLLWGGLAWYISAQNGDLLAHRISPLILSKDAPMTLIAVTALIGGLTAGFAALRGSLLRNTLEKRTQS
jgi:hypothetical protein